MIKETHIEILLNARNASRLKGLGYKIPQNGKEFRTPHKIGYAVGTKISIRVEDLSPESKVKVTRICNDCGKEDLGPYREFLKAPFCKSCRAKGEGNQFHGKAHTLETKAKLSEIQRTTPDEAIIKYLEETGIAPTSKLAAKHWGRKLRNYESCSQP